MNPLLQQGLGTLIRHLLTYAAGRIGASAIWGENTGEYIGALSVAIMAVGWSLWQKYRGRVKLLTALSMETKMSERHLDDVVAGGITPPVLTPPDAIPKAVVALLLASGLMAGCGASSAKQHAVVTFQATETALGAFQDAERALYAAKTLPDLTAARHREISAALERAFGLQVTIGHALLAWKAGQPPPLGLDAWFREAETILTLIGELTPGAARDTLWTQVTAWARTLIETARLLGRLAPPTLSAKLKALFARQPSEAELDGMVRETIADA